MYNEYREPKCIVCKTAKPTCGDPAIYCRSCAIAIQTGRPSGVGRGSSPAWCVENPSLDNVIKIIEENRR